MLFLDEHPELINILAGSRVNEVLLGDVAAVNAKGYVPAFDALYIMAG